MSFPTSITRRGFVSGGAAFALSARSSSAQTAIVVSPTGDDNAPGTAAHPLRTMERALVLHRHRRASAVLLRGGVFELARPLHITAADVPLHIAAWPGEEPVLSGGTRLSLAWRPFRDGIQQATVPAGTTTDQIFINGRRQVLARYPNFDAASLPLNGTSADAFSPERVARWSRPAGGYVHAMHAGLWGSLHYRILGRNADNTLRLEGGWQINRPDPPMHKRFRFVENIFEELDAPGEWFLDEHRSTLYFYPPADVRLDTASVDIVRLRNLIKIGGEDEAIVCGVTLSGITFRHTLRTFMETRDSLLRSDWRIARCGAVLTENAEDVLIEDCFFDQPGGNAIFVSGHNRRVRLQRVRIEEAGASGVCFDGRPEASRSPVLDCCESALSLATIDRTSGPSTAAFPADCSLEDSLIVATGRVEKQSAPVEISIAQSIAVRHCSLYGVPRAGINIGTGAFGGHTIEHCDVFDTVLETSDHGAFNSWGRDRWWHLAGADADALLREPATRALPTLDAVLPIAIAHNRLACEHGWDIDLDDGSTNYRIAGNLCLCGGIKLREGFLRVVENNIAVNNTLHPHVWPADSEDIVHRNIFFVPYKPIHLAAWGRTVDFNLLHHPGVGPAQSALVLQRISGQDAHSISGDALFANAAAGDFSLLPASPARRLGFVSFRTDHYGVQSPRLRALARTPDIPRLLALEPETIRSGRKRDEAQWMGAAVRNLVGLGEVSAFGSPGETGVVFETLPANCTAARAGLAVGDLLLSIGDQHIGGTPMLLKVTAGWQSGTQHTLHLLRRQQPVTLTLTAP